MFLQLQTCEKCFSHKQFGHNQWIFYDNYCKLAEIIDKNCKIKILKNIKIPLSTMEYLQRVQLTQNQFIDRVVEQNKQKIKPQIGSFEIRYRNMQIFSLHQSQEEFPDYNLVSKILLIVKKLPEMALFNLACQLKNSDIYSLYQFVRSKGNFVNEKTIKLKTVQDALNTEKNIKKAKLSMSKQRSNKNSQINGQQLKQFIKKQNVQNVRKSEQKQNIYSFKRKESVNSCSKVGSNQNQSSKAFQQVSVRRRTHSKKNRGSNLSASRNSKEQEMQVKLRMQKRIRCKKFSNRYSSMKKKSQFINKLVKSQYSKIKEQNYEYLSKESDLNPIIGTNNFDFELEQLSSSSGEDENIFRNQRKLSQFKNVKTTKQICIPYQKQNHYSMISKTEKPRNNKKQPHEESKYNSSDEEENASPCKIQATTKKEQINIKVEKMNLGDNKRIVSISRINLSQKLEELRQPQVKQTIHSILEFKDEQTKRQALEQNLIIKHHKQQINSLKNDKKQPLKQQKGYKSQNAQKIDKLQQKQVDTKIQKVEQIQKLDRSVKLLKQQQQKNQQHLQVQQLKNKEQNITNEESNLLQKVEVLNQAQKTNQTQVRNQQKVHTEQSAEIKVKNQMILEGQLNKNKQQTSFHRNDKISNQKQQQIIQKQIIQQKIELSAEKFQNLSSLKQDRIIQPEHNQVNCKLQEKCLNKSQILHEKYINQQNSKKQQVFLNQKKLENNPSSQKKEQKYGSKVPQKLKQNQNISKGTKFYQFFSTHLNNFQENAQKYFNSKNTSQLYKVQNQSNKLEKYLSQLNKPNIEQFLDQIYPCPKLVMDTKNKKKISKILSNLIEQDIQPQKQWIQINEECISKIFLLSSQNMPVKVTKIVLNQHNVLKTKLYLSKPQDSIQQFIDLKQIQKQQDKIMFLFYSSQFDLYGKKIVFDSILGNQRGKNSFKQFKTICLHIKIDEKIKKYDNLTLEQFSQKNYLQLNNNKNESNNHIFISFENRKNNLTQRQWKSIQQDNENSGESQISIQVFQDQEQEISIGSIKKKANFFFQLNLEKGQYYIRITNQDLFNIQDVVSLLFYTSTYVQFLKIDV